MLIFVVLLIIVLYVICRCCGNNEGFVHVQPSAHLPVPHEYNATDNEINIPLPNYDSEKKAIFSSTDYIPYKITPAWSNQINKIDDDNDSVSNMFNLCSPSCCTQQYPIPHKLDSDPLIAGKENTFVPSTMTCRNSVQNAGCMCVNKDEMNLLSTRGGNM